MTRARTGAPTSLARHDMGHATIIDGSDRDSSGQKIDPSISHISIFITYTIRNNIKSIATFSSSFLYLLLFGFVKLVFAAVLAGIGSALSVVIAYLQILYAFKEVEAYESFFYLVGSFVYPTALILI